MRVFGIPFPLLDKAGAEGGSGGGGAEGGKAADEAPLTRAEVGALISGALKGEGKRQIAAAVKDALDGLKLGETIASEVAKLKPAEPPEPKPGEGKPDPKIAALETKLAEVTDKLKAEAEARQKAVEESRAKDARAALRSALTPLVRPEALDIAVRDLFDAQKRVTLDESGNPLIRVRRKDYAGADEDVDMPIADGVGHWINTQEGKFFAPAPGVQSGAGPKGGNAPRRVSLVDGAPRYEKPADSDTERDRRIQDRMNAYQQRDPSLR